MITETVFDAGEVRLNYAEGPDSGPPLVLLHGGSSRWQHFSSIIPDLARQWRIFAPDMRGHGESGRVPGRYRVKDYAQDIVSLLRERVREPAVLFGHSLGGIVALMVAAQAPEWTRAVIVGDSPLTAETWGAVLERDRQTLCAWRRLSGGRCSEAEIAAAIKDLPIPVPGRDAPVRTRELYGEDSPVYAWVAANLYRQDPGVLGALIDDFAATAEGYEMERLLPAIRCPVLLLQADPRCGQAMPDADVDRGLALLARPSHVRLEGISHVLHNERKEPVLAAVAAFLEAILMHGDNQTSATVESRLPPVTPA